MSVEGLILTILNVMILSGGANWQWSPIIESLDLLYVSLLFLACWVVDSKAGFLTFEPTRTMDCGNILPYEDKSNSDVDLLEIGKQQ